ncbi:MAG: mechanosensitive ion channel family protein [bacterium]
MEKELEQFQSLYNVLAEFFIKYSFQVLGAILILIIGMIIAGRVARAVENFCLRKELDVTLSHFLASCTKIAIVVAIAVMALSKVGISITPLVAAIGAISLGAGLAVQGLLSNYGAGLNIILTRPFVVGDTIRIQGVTGVVKEVRLAYTLLKDEDDVTITIPNRHIVGEILHNSHEHCLAETTLGVAYGSDTFQVIEIIRTVLENYGVNDTRPPQIGIDEFGDSSLNFNIRFWVPTEKFHETRFNVNNALYEAVKKAGISIPFPQREIRMLGGSGDSVQGTDAS